MRNQIVIGIRLDPRVVANIDTQARMVGISRNKLVTEAINDKFGEIPVLKIIQMRTQK